MRYVYIDGASLDKAVSSFSGALSLDSIPFDYGMFVNNLQADRAFYYDAFPARKPADTDEVYEVRRAEKEKHFSTLNAIPRLFVRIGTSKYSRNQGMLQKGVDVLLAVEAMTHAYSGVNDWAIFVVSDLDFFPILNALQQTRVRTLLHYRPDATSTDLLEFADHTQRLGQLTLLKACEPNWAAQYFPSRQNESYPLTEEERGNTKVHKLGGNEYAIWKEQDGWVM